MDSSNKVIAGRRLLDKSYNQYCLKKTRVRSKARRVIATAPTTCRCGSLSNSQLNVGARKIFQKRIRIIDGWIKDGKLDYVKPSALENMWKALPYNQKHIYYSQVLEQLHRGSRVGFLPSKEESRQINNSNALMAMLQDLEENADDSASKCRCILGAKFTEPSVNFYIEGNGPNTLPLQEISQEPISSQLPLIKSRNQASALQVPVRRRSRIATKKSGLVTPESSALPKRSKETIKSENPDTSRPKTTRRPPSKAHMLKQFQNIQIPNNNSQKARARARAAVFEEQEPESVFAKLLDCTVTRVPSPVERTPSPSLWSIRSFRKTASELPVEKRRSSASSSSDVQIIPNSMEWNRTSSEISYHIPDEVAYYALSIVEVTYGDENEDVSFQLEPPKKKRRVRGKSQKAQVNK